MYNYAILKPILTRIIPLLSIKMILRLSDCFFVFRVTFRCAAALLCIPHPSLYIERNILCIMHSSLCIEQSIA